MQLLQSRTYQFTVASGGYLQKFFNFCRQTAKDIGHAGNAVSAGLAGPLLHQVPLPGAGAQCAAHGVGLQEHGVESAADESPVGGEEALTEGRVVGRGAEVLNEDLGLVGETLLSLQSVSQLS